MHANRFGQIHRAHRVGEKRAARIGKAGGRVALRREMKHAVERGFAHQIRQRFVVGQVAEMKAERVEDAIGNDVANIVLAPVRCAHEAVHFMLFFDEQIGQVRPDEAGDAGDQVAHVRVEDDP